MKALVGASNKEEALVGGLFRDCGASRRVDLALLLCRLIHPCFVEGFGPATSGLDLLVEIYSNLSVILIPLGSSSLAAIILII